MQYNPTEYTLDKQVTLGEVAIPGLDAPLQQFVRGNAEKLTLDLFFDTTEHGMGAGARQRHHRDRQDLPAHQDRAEAPRAADPHLRLERPVPRQLDRRRARATSPAPPRRRSPAPSRAPRRPRSSRGRRRPAASARPRSRPLAAALGNQRRNGFRCVMESIKQKFTLFSSGRRAAARDAHRLRCASTRRSTTSSSSSTCSSPDRTHVHVLRRPTRSPRSRNRYYDRPGDWRAIADENAIDDPRRLHAGRVLEVPPLA